MNFLDKLEKKIGKFAIPHLMLYLIICYVAGYILYISGNYQVLSLLSLNAEMICRGQIWRIVTFVIQPPTSSSIFFFAITLYFYYVLGSNLEKLWGSFKFNVYIFSGLIFNVLAVLVIYWIFGISISMTLYYVNLSLFLAFAMECAESVFMLFFIIPIKAKWLAAISGAYFVATVVIGYIGAFVTIPLNIRIGLASFGIGSSPEQATAALIAMANFLVYFFVLMKKRFKNKSRNRDYSKRFNNAGGYYSASSNKADSSQGTVREEKKEKKASHKCVVCGKTDLDDEDEVFRYCSKCRGVYEYCSEHIRNHEHK